MKPARTSHATATILLRAAFVVPVNGPVIRKGEVLVRGDRIIAVGSREELSSSSASETRDLGDAVILPGLVNAHCHLDYTHMAGQFPPPAVFTDWLKTITEAKSGWAASDYIDSWLSGARMLVNTGTTTVGDIEAIPNLLPKCRPATPLRVFSFLEMIGITNRRTPTAILQEALRNIKKLAGGARCAGLSPHAPYSTTPELLALSARAARQRGLRVSIHAAESSLEYEMFQQGRGPMFQWIQHSGRDMSDCGARSPVEHLRHCGLLGEQVVVAHANYLARGDARLLAATGTHVAHCPRSHVYFRHEPFPLRRLARAGVNICIGTDSLASVYKRGRQEVELSLFDEMRAVKEAHPEIADRQILRMATRNGARALGMAGKAGEISAGAQADLVVVRAPESGRQVYEAVLAHRGNVLASMIRGTWAIPPGKAGS